MSTNNKIIVRGRIRDDVDLDYSRGVKKFYGFKLQIRRTSGTIDEVLIIAKEDLFPISNEPTAYVEVTGEIRTRNYLDDNGKSHLQIYVFANTIDDVRGTATEEDVNDTELIGYICKKPVYRQTPKGKEVCDITLAVQRKTPGRSDYVPCIAWGSRAKWCSKLEVGAKVIIDGRLQSRIYHKDNDPRTAYEVSIMTIKLSSED